MFNYLSIKIIKQFKTNKWLIKDKKLFTKTNDLIKL